VSRPHIPSDCQHNGHLYYLLASSLEERTALLAFLKSRGIGSVFHYVPLHSAPAGLKYARVHGSMGFTDSCSDRLLRLPLWSGLASADVDRVIETVFEFFKQR
jgi:dTDP-4-amino-4,6-dideoxygalactose transaminase